MTQAMEPGNWVEDVDGKLRNMTVDYTPRPSSENGRLHTVQKILPSEPFPVEALPSIVRQFVEAAHKAIGCDPAYVALPALASLAGAIGTTYQIRLKHGWCEPCVLWPVIVGESGTLKSPAIDVATAPLKAMQAKALTRWQHSMDRYEEAMLDFQKALGAWKRQKGGDAPTKPETPVCPRTIISDTTVEALAQRLAENPRGLLLVRDELSAWLGGMNQYKGGRGADVAAYLEMHRAGPLLVDRKSGGVTHVPRAAVSITGGIQPRVLRDALRGEHFENGLAARLLLAMPNPPTKKWTEAEISPDVSSRYAQMMTRLVELRHDHDDDGNPCPHVVTMTPEAKAVWIEFYNQHAKEQADLTGDLAAAWSKLEGYAARLALVTYLAEIAVGGEFVGCRAVDEVAMQSGITLAKWFASEARRLYAVLGESDEARDQRRLLELIKRKGGHITPREMQRSDARRYPTADQAEKDLNVLSKVGLGRWEVQHTHTNTRRVFILSDSPTPDRFA